MQHSHFAHLYDGQTVLSPVGLAAVIILGLALLLLPRRYSPIPMLMMACFIPPAQRITVFSLNFDLLRLMVLFGSVRVVARGEWCGFRWVFFDTIFALWAAYSLLTFALLFNSFEPIKYKLGTIYDAVGMYFLFRMLIRDLSDLDVLSKAFAWIALPTLAAFLCEWSTRHNVFSAMGGVPEITDIRLGRVRCQGAFAHPILAGCFWASALPLIVVQWWRRAIPRWLIVLSTSAVLGIVALCASSTPVSGLLLAIPAAMLFRFRYRMSWILIGGVAALVALQCVMNHPIWFILARVDFASGSTGWFRYFLMQQAINHIGEWWLIGSNIGTEHWGAGLFDVTNEYIVQGLQGGLLLLALFVTIIGMGFREIGLQVRAAGRDKRKQVMVWAIGVSLFLHASSFIGVSYFGQIILLWYLTLAIIGSLRASRVGSRPLLIQSSATRARRQSRRAALATPESTATMEASATIFMERKHDRNIVSSGVVQHARHDPRVHPVNLQGGDDGRV